MYPHSAEPIQQFRDELEGGDRRVTYEEDTCQRYIDMHRHHEERSERPEVLASEPWNLTGWLLETEPNLDINARDYKHKWALCLLGMVWLWRYGILAALAVGWGALLFTDLWRPVVEEVGSTGTIRFHTTPSPPVEIATVAAGSDITGGAISVDAKGRVVQLTGPITATTYPSCVSMSGEGVITSSGAVCGSGGTGTIVSGSVGTIPVWTASPPGAAPTPPVIKVTAEDWAVGVGFKVDRDSTAIIFSGPYLRNGYVIVATNMTSRADLVAAGGCTIDGNRQVVVPVGFRVVVSASSDCNLHTSLTQNKDSHP